MLPTSDYSRNRRPFRWWLAAGSLASILAVFLVVNGLNGDTPPEGPPAEQAESPQAVQLPHYPISGYFIYSAPSDARNQKKLEEIKSVGGDTVITFGSVLSPATLATLPTDCKINGENCGEVIGSKLKIGRYFTFSDGGQWGKPALQCPNDRLVEVPGRTYTVMVFPSNNGGCTAKDGVYDLVVAGGSPSTAADPTISVASAATKLNMRFYAGLPAPAKRTDFEYLPDLSYQNTLQLFTERFLRYQADVNDVAGLAGFYHHFEMPVTDNSFFDPVVSLYAMQNKAIHRVLPDRSAIVSPYIESRRSSAAITPADARRGARKLAGTASGLQLSIAIQDGMGTGKGAAYRATEAGGKVDSFAASIVGRGTWGSKYAAPNSEYFDAAAEGVKGTQAELWANLEGMAPATEANPCEQSLRGQTTIDRVDRQLQQMGSTRKIISFMWDPYFTCSGTNQPLREDLQQGLATPLITDISSDVVNGGAVKVTGFNLEGISYALEFIDKKGDKHRTTGQPAVVKASFGREQGLNPQLQSVTIDLGKAAPPTDTAYQISVSNERGSSTETVHPTPAKAAVG
ncbi:hypothetical protein [Paenarthrobacter ureafaciens]|uniref:hypothetical protein n=1 Tax=Paenarthrobacter ureafaciens TaxID=37931 RepID=UPI003CE71B69